MSVSVADLHVGSAVYSSQGEKVGRLRFMMVDTESETVSHLILEKGMLLGQDVLAPVTTVSQVLFRGIFLTLSSEEVLALPEFNEVRYLQRERSHGGGEGREGRPHHHHHNNGERGDRQDRGERSERSDRPDHRPRNGGNAGARRFRRH